jgi:hypothetical protein
MGRTPGEILIAGAHRAVLAPRDAGAAAHLRDALDRIGPNEAAADHMNGLQVFLALHVYARWWVTLIPPMRVRYAPALEALADAALEIVCARPLQPYRADLEG